MELGPPEARKIQTRPVPPVRVFLHPSGKDSERRRGHELTHLGSLTTQPGPQIP